MPAPMSTTSVSLRRFMPYAIVNGSETIITPSKAALAASSMTFLLSTLARDGAPMTP